MEKYYAGLMAHGPIGSGVASIKTTLEPPQPPMSKLYAAVDRLGKASSNLGDISNRLCGAHPNTPASGETEAPNGMFDEVEYLASQISSMADRILADTGRISSRL